MSATDDKRALIVKEHVPGLIDLILPDDDGHVASVSVWRDGVQADHKETAEWANLLAQAPALKAEIAALREAVRWEGEQISWYNKQVWFNCHPVVHNILEASHE